MGDVVMPHTQRRRGPYPDKNDLRPDDDLFLILGRTLGRPLLATRINNDARPKYPAYRAADSDEWKVGYHPRNSDGLLLCQCWCGRNYAWVTERDVFSGRTFLCNHPECVRGASGTAKRKPHDDTAHLRAAKPKPKPVMKPTDYANYDPTIFDPPCPTCGAPPRRRCLNVRSQRPYGFFYVHAARRVTPRSS